MSLVSDVIVPVWHKEKYASVLLSLYFFQYNFYKKVIGPVAIPSFNIECNYILLQVEIRTILVN